MLFPSLPRVLLLPVQQLIRGVLLLKCRCTWTLVLLFVVTVLMNTINAAASSSNHQSNSIFSASSSACPNAPSCRLFGLSALSSYGVTMCDMKTQREICTFFPSLFYHIPTTSTRYQCGRCCLGPYTMDLSFGNVSIADQGYFVTARDRWQKSILCSTVGMIKQQDIPQYGSNCPLPTTINNMHICASLESLDGPGGILAISYPVSTISKNGRIFPYLGEMRFDVGDFDRLKTKGTFGSIVLHEMGHMLGIGSYWFLNSLIDQDDPPCQYMSHTKANLEWQKISGCSSNDIKKQNKKVVPIENSGGAGTRCHHWNEDCLKDELMTGYLKGSTKDYLSRITLATLEDSGYVVDYDNADIYTRSDISPSCLCQSSGDSQRRRLGTSNTSNETSFVQSETNNDSSTIQRPQLSLEALLQIQAYGQDILASHRRRRSSSNRRPMNQHSQQQKLQQQQDSNLDHPENKEHTIVVDDLFLEIVYEENDHFFFVPVTQQQQQQQP